MKPLPRPSWDKYFIDMLPLIASRSTCLRRQVSAILVKDKRIIATGFNGPPPGLPHCSELGGCLREKLKIKSGQRDEICRAVHAEQNAIIQCAIYGNSTEGAILYCNFFPCAICTKMILAAKISRIVYTDNYPSELSLELIKQAKDFKLVKYREDLEISLKLDDNKSIDFQNKWHGLYMERLQIKGELTKEEAELSLNAGMDDFDYTDDPVDCADDELSIWKIN